MRPQFLQQSAFESLDLKVKASQCKHWIFSIAHIGNHLLALLAPLCIFPVFVLEVFWELPIISCEISTDAPLFAPSACFRLMDQPSSWLVGFGAPTWYTTIYLISKMGAINAKTFARLRDHKPCPRHWIDASTVCNADSHSSISDAIGFVSSTSSTPVSTSISVMI